jgi:hypothetical protein
MEFIRRFEPSQEALANLVDVLYQLLSETAGDDAESAPEQQADLHESTCVSNHLEQ